MSDLKIDRLRLNIQNAAGHEHRIQGIAERAMSLFARRWADAGGRDSREIESLTLPPVDLNLGSMSDEQASQAIASALFEGLGR